jgi:hypothetical protein
MQAHPVPQNITGFEFKLVGFLTIRQFGYLAAAGILSFIIYVLPLYLIIKVFLILPLVLLGFALALLPVNDIPFDRWLVSFIRSVYSPTKLIWRKEPVELGFLAPEFSIYLQRQTAPLKAAPADRRRLEQFIAQNKHRQVSALDSEEEKLLSQISSEAANLAFGDKAQETPNTAEINNTEAAQSVPNVGYTNKGI